MLVRFGCGCIGFPPEKDKIVLVRRCGDMPVGLSIEVPNYILPENLPGTPLTQEHENRIFEEIASWISNGYKFRDLKQLLAEKEM
jgi:hypothetical protein